VATLIMTGVFLVIAPRYRTLWASGRAYISAMRTAASAQDICGLGLYGENVWGLSGGYTWFGRDVPMLMVTSVDDLAIASKGFNYLIYVGPNPLPGHWSNTQCWAGVEGETVCLARSDTKCEEQNYFDVNRELEREER
jgi:GPI mannosyltransferase 3